MIVLSEMRLEILPADPRRILDSLADAPRVAPAPQPPQTSQRGLYLVLRPRS